MPPGGKIQVRADNGLTGPLTGWCQPPGVLTGWEIASAKERIWYERRTLVPLLCRGFGSTVLGWFSTATCLLHI